MHLRGSSLCEAWKIQKGDDKGLSSLVAFSVELVHVNCSSKFLKDWRLLGTEHLTVTGTPSMLTLKVSKAGPLPWRSRPQSTHFSKWYQCQARKPSVHSLSWYWWSIAFLSWGFEESNVTNGLFYFAVRTDKLEGLVSCSETCKYLWDGFGQWKQRQWMPYLKGLKCIFKYFNSQRGDLATVHQAKRY